jgi:hypothetical protein
MKGLIWRYQFRYSSNRGIRVTAFSLLFGVPGSCAQCVDCTRDLNPKQTPFLNAVIQERACASGGEQGGVIAEF